MKKLIAPFVALLLFGFGITSDKLTDEERKKAVMTLTQTHENLVNSLEGLSEAQLNFKSSQESWSIANCVEHIAISENAFAEMLQGTMSATPDESMKANVVMSDEEVYAMISSREKKVKTSEPFEPSGKFGTHEETLEAFTAKRSKHIEYLSTTEDDFRNHYKEMPFGTIDAYQMVLFMAGHTERHTQQIEEIKSQEDFPQE